MPLKGVRYRYKRGTKMRLAFKGSDVVEAKNMQTGAVHTPEEFAQERRREARCRAKGACRGHGSKVSAGRYLV